MIMILTQSFVYSPSPSGRGGTFYHSMADEYVST